MDPKDLKTLKRRTIRRLDRPCFYGVSAILGFVFAAIVFTTACSVPNLESQQCSEARDVVKKFYSFHFANDMTPSPESLKASEQFLTDVLYHELAG